jgi:hypothetical protein
MIIAFISIALVSQFGSPLVIQAGDLEPVINVEKTCKNSVAADNEAKIALAQPLENCMRDENNAKQQLSAVWSTSPAPIRDRCEGSDSFRRRQLCRPVDLHADEQLGECNTNDGPEGRQQKSKQELAARSSGKN